MRGRFVTALGVLLVAALTIEPATAAARIVRKVARAPVTVTHQFRNAYSSAPATVRGKSCDIFWCYEN